MASLSTVPSRPQHPAVAVARVLVEAEVGHHDELVAEVVAQGSKRHLGDARAGPRRRCRRRPCVDGTPKRMTPPTPDATQRLHLVAQR